MPQPKFNPYRQWLGIDVESRPTYYQLFGTSAEELHNGAVEPPAIAQAAQQLIDQLRQVDASGQEELRERLLRRIQRAAVCLSDDALRRQYDQRLIREREAEQARKQAPTYAPRKVSLHQGPAAAAIVMRQIKAPPPTRHPQGAASSRPRPKITAWGRQTRRRHRRLRTLVTSLLLATLGLAGSGYLIVTQTPWGQSLTSAATVAPLEQDTTTVRPLTSAPPTGESSAPRATRTESTSQPAAAELDQPPPTAKDPPPPVISAGPTSAELQALGATLSEAKRGLANRKFSQAEAALAKARQLARRPEDVAKTRRLATLANYVEGYWKAAADGLRQVQSGEELVINGKRVYVVEKTSTTLVLRQEGRNLSYPLDELPLDLQNFFALRWFDNNAASTHVFRGAMLAVSNQADPEEIRRLWRTAESSGEIDLGDLEQVLDDVYETASR